MGTGPPAMTEIESKCVGTELNRQSPKAGGLRPLELTSAQPIRTHSIAVSETTWSASCLPSHIHAGAQSEIRTHNHSILSRVALPIGASRLGNAMIPDGLEPSFSGCKPEVVAAGPRDHIVC